MKKAIFRYVFVACAMVCMLIFFIACNQVQVEQVGSVEPVNNTNFNPPKNIQIKRTYAMSADGVTIRKLESVREDDTAKSFSLHIHQEVAQSLLSFNQLADTKAEEVLWLAANGLEAYQGKFTDVTSGEEFCNRISHSKEMSLDFRI